ncbi:MAG: hypothetical protein H6835_15115 [Planctomycetes bacterium]|nr:hypothetical protein [Planctomycetota bacterium]
MGLLDWFKKPTAPQTRQFFLGNESGDVVANIEMRCHSQGVAATISTARGQSTEFPSVGIAADAILELAGQLILDKFPKVGDTLFFLEVDGRSNRARLLARVALQGNNMIECHEVDFNDLTDSSVLHATSWPIHADAMEKTHARLALAEVKGLGLDLTLLQSHRGRRTLPGARASWATIYVSRDKKQTLGPVLDVVPAAHRLDVRVVHSDGATKSLISAQGKTFADEIQAWMQIGFEHGVILKLAQETGMPNPAFIAVAALEQQGFRPLSATYIMDKYICEEAFSAYRRHPLEAQWLVPWL